MRSPMARSSRISSGSTSRVPGGMAVREVAGVPATDRCCPVIGRSGGYAGTRSVATRSIRAPSSRSRSSIRS
jgi:hypothetical protein